MSKSIKYMLLLAFIFSLSACASLQTVPTEERNIQKVHEINLNKNEIYDKSLEWMAQTFNDSKAVIELKDRETGKIIGKGMTSFTNVVVVIPCRFTMMIEAKDGKYRTTYNNFIGMWGEFRNQPRDVEELGYLTEVKTKITDLDNSLLAYLNGAKKDNNW